MSNRPWMPFYVGDFLADTMHLSATETGIYLRLILHCWQHGTIPRNGRQLAIISHCDTRLWHQYSETVLQFFDVVDASTMHHKRVSTELRRSEEISNKRKGSAEQMLKKREANVVQLLTHARAGLQSQSQLQRKKEDISVAARPHPASVDWPSDHAEQFWRQYPLKVGKKAALRCLDAVRRRNEVPFADLMAALMRYAAKQDDRPFCHPTTWINQGRWTDEPASNANGHVQKTHPLIAAADKLVARARRDLDEHEARYRDGDGEGPIIDGTISEG